MRLLYANATEQEDEGEDRIMGTTEELSSFVSAYEKICSIKQKYAMADQVCVMQSDGTNSWIEQVGYSSEDNIKRAIVNYLEGGIEPFKHKTKVYEPIMN